MPMPPRLAARFAEMSPYLLRDLLLSHARLVRGPEVRLLDATREAPNWQQRDAQLAWHVLGLYCDYVYGVVGDPGNVRLIPSGTHFDHEAAFNRFTEGLMDLRESLAIGTDFLSELWPHLAKKVLPGRSESEVIEAFTRAMSGASYPSPGNLDFVGPIVANYLAPRLFAGDSALAGQFELHLTPGASAGLVQVAQTLAHSHLLAPGDKVAAVLPAPQPVLELFARQYGHEIVGLAADPLAGYQPAGQELARLGDPAVKLLVLSSPGDPRPAAASPATLAALAPVMERRPDLLILADYSAVNLLPEPGPTVVAQWPRQTIGLYSFSRDYGLAGARLGMVLVHRQCVANDLLRRLPKAAQDAASARYATRLPEPATAGFFARLVEESAGVAFGHVAGLATPAQVLLCLCAAYEAVAEPVADTYLQWVREELARRHAALYRGAGLAAGDEAAHTARHCALVDLEGIAVAAGGPVARRLQHLDIWTVLFHLAHETGIIVLPGLPFGGAAWSARVPLAALSEVECETVGASLVAVLHQLARHGPCARCRELTVANIGN
jgi:aspartate 4-decarboxylase